jgi:transcriptional regulator with XRE-family HTH domain
MDMAWPARSRPEPRDDELEALEEELAALVRALDAAGRLGSDERRRLAHALEGLERAQRVAMDRVDLQLGRQLYAELTGLAEALALDDDPESQLDEVGIRLEALRQVLRDRREGAAVWRDSSGPELARWLHSALAGTSQADLAQLLGVSQKTVYRWLADESSIAPRDEQRLRALCAVVAQLRHSLTSGGIVAWLREAAIEGLSPIQRIASGRDLGLVLESAAALRGA